MIRGIAIAIAVVLIVAGSLVFWYGRAGGALHGVVTPTPTDWEFTHAVETVFLETRPADPYSVRIWVTAVGNALYLYAGGNHAQWAKNLEADPRARLLIEGALYDLIATKTVDADEIDRFSSAYREKYSYDPYIDRFEEIHLYRLEAR